MRDRDLLLGLGLAAGALYLWQRSNSGTSPPAGDFFANPVAAVSEAVVGTLTGWKNVGSAAQWLPVLAQAEQMNDLPTDLLARVAYQESHFRESIIRGTHTSSVGALGIMQLMPQFYPSVRVPTPFDDNAVTTQIYDAGNTLAANFKRFGSWELALAAYNAGAGNVDKYGGIPPFTETQNYVAQIAADVPALASVA